MLTRQIFTWKRHICEAPASTTLQDASLSGERRAALVTAGLVLAGAGAIPSLLGAGGAVVLAMRPHYWRAVRAISIVVAVSGFGIWTLGLRVLGCG